MQYLVFLLLFILLTANPGEAKLHRADKVVVLKKARRLILMRNGKMLKSYRVALGTQPLGAKSRRGDGRTPEGTYVLDRRNAGSRFYRSIHVSYPGRADLAKAHRQGVDAGSGIMIHGLPKGFEELSTVHTTVNWTKGCIAVSNTEIDEIWTMVPDGIPIEIKP